MLSSGVLVYVSLDDWDIKIEELICEADRPPLKKIVTFCFEQKAAAVLLFIDYKHGNYSCVGYMPIYDDKDILKQYKNAFHNIEDGMFLGAFFVDNTDELKNEELMYVLKKRARNVALWNGDYGIMVFRERS